jgi:hypothetical protein
MTDAGLMRKASIDWDHLDTTDSTGDLGSLINLARPRGFHVSAAADEIFEVEEKLTGLCVCHGTAAQVHRYGCCGPLLRCRTTTRASPRSACASTHRFSPASMPPPSAWGSAAQPGCTLRPASAWWAGDDPVVGKRDAGAARVGVAYR